MEVKNINNFEIVYKDLLYTQNAYYSGEQIFPYWENIHALVISGLIIILFSTQNNSIGKLVICLVGILFSINWLLVVNRSYLYAISTFERIEYLENLILKELSLNNENKIEGYLPFVLTGYQKEFIKSQKQCWNTTSSWSLRKNVPRYLIIIWLCLILYELLSYIWPIAIRSCNN